MTPEEWKEVGERLKDFYHSVELMCDGYKVTIILGRISPMENAILLYINSVMKFKWLTEDCEERRRFMRPRKKLLYSPKQRTNLKKVSKRLRQKYKLPDPDASIIGYLSYWKSFSALKRHLIKHNENIELVK